MVEQEWTNGERKKKEERKSVSQQFFSWIMVQFLKTLQFESHKNTTVSVAILTQSMKSWTHLASQRCRLADFALFSCWPAGANLIAPWPIPASAGNRSWLTAPFPYHFSVKERCCVFSVSMLFTFQPNLNWCWKSGFKFVWLYLSPCGCYFVEAGPFWVWREGNLRPCFVCVSVAIQYGYLPNHSDLKKKIPLSNWFVCVSILGWTTTKACMKAWVPPAICLISWLFF